MITLPTHTTPSLAAASSKQKDWSPTTGLANIVSFRFRYSVLTCPKLFPCIQDFEMKFEQASQYSPFPQPGGLRNSSIGEVQMGERLLLDGCYCSMSFLFSKLDRLR